MILAVLGAVFLALSGWYFGRRMGRYAFVLLTPEQTVSVVATCLGYVLLAGLTHMVFMHFTMQILPNMSHVAFILALVTGSLLVWFTSFFWPLVKLF